MLLTLANSLNYAIVGTDFRQILSSGLKDKVSLKWN